MIPPLEKISSLETCVQKEHKKTGQKETEVVLKSFLYLKLFNQ